MTFKEKGHKTVQRAIFETDNLPPHGWKRAAITIHDHWLSEEETDNHWMFYGGATSEAEKAEYLTKEKAFVSLFEDLQKKYGLHAWDEHQEYADEETVRARCIDALREIRFSLFKSDSLQLVVMGNHDLTFPVFAPFNHDWDELGLLVLGKGLFLLD